MVPTFSNEPFLDFSIETNRARQQEAIDQVLASAGTTYPLVIGGERVMAGATFDRVNPSRKDQVLGKFQKADGALAQKAMDAALKAYDSWKWFSAKERGLFLIRVAAIMRKKRFLLNAWMIVEEGKNWLEADGDTAEAIDFCEFYGREMIRLAEHQELTTRSGEAVELKYIPLGVGAVIPPWNFPNAILTGMTTAAIVTGNTVVLKPASYSPGIAYQVFLILEEAGMPPGVVNFLTGPGSIAGDVLVKHPKTRFIAFTGSMDVGLMICENAARLSEGQIWIKRTILEMGGKDFIIVDDEADLDSAVPQVLSAAFGFQGQKCSACSRLILHEKIYDRFMERFLPMVQNIKVGDPVNRDNYMGPVIAESAFKSIMRYIEIGKEQGKLLTGGNPGSDSGYFIQPTVIASSPGDTIVREEIFGPVVAVLKANSFDHAIELANDSIYGLTGAAFTRSRAKIHQAKRQLHAGNLYINRKCTGALVGVHPFGGFNMSGTDSKAGGRDYLLLFTQAKSISETFS
ncbi:MAG TPA: L-glutamate gamma-semialdehyde dehydrogenase [Thermoanaerobaculia bacterium]|nr:L-glutamate gamma-semialdehyde dehydrogenase [Thermoanaerobaculia bacterium]HUM28587.1 L-glutamate gamma-semialdehyde dehydrogenase [Thermoanaerobaculia bacterium]HXK66805.1 L-glutamate gamma-semialdehyde dehydrogenase [Thermoanaerobaculia bacterium]